MPASGPEQAGNPTFQIGDQQQRGLLAWMQTFCSSDAGGDVFLRFPGRLGESKINFRATWTPRRYHNLSLGWKKLCWRQIGVEALLQGAGGPTAPGLHPAWLSWRPGPGAQQLPAAQLAVKTDQARKVCDSEAAAAAGTVSRWAAVWRRQQRAPGRQWQQDRGTPAGAASSSSTLPPMASTAAGITAPCTPAAKSRRCASDDRRRLPVPPKTCNATGPPLALILAIVRACCIPHSISGCSCCHHQAHINCMRSACLPARRPLHAGARVLPGQRPPRGSAAGGGGAHRADALLGLLWGGGGRRTGLLHQQACDV